MGIKLPRHKPRVFLLSILYRLIKLPLSNTLKLKLFLNLEWIFDRLAHEMSYKTYSVENHPSRIKAKDFLSNVLDKNHRVLDLGCSIGDFTNVIAERAEKVVGIDHDCNSIAEAKEKYRKVNLEFVCADAREFLQDNKENFDVLVLSHILEHLDEPKNFLLNFKKYFNYIYIEVPDFDKSPANHFRKDLKMELIHSDDDHVSEFDRYDLESLFNECSIEVIKSEYIFGIQRYWCKI